PGYTDFTVTSAYAQALAQTIWDLVATGATGIFHATSPDPMSKYEFGLAVAAEFALPTELITPTSMDLVPPRGHDLSLDVTKVQHWLGRDLLTQRAGLTRARADQELLRRRISVAG
ncbi:MAG: hypothetical protein ACYC2Z_06825, partial [Candidatus Nanopelagicales bacterium]